MTQMTTDENSQILKKKMIMKYGKVKKELHEKKGMVLPNGAK